MQAIRAVALASLFLTTIDLLAQESKIPWHSIPKTAMAVARGQQKLLLLYYRGTCLDGCNLAMDAMFEKNADDEVFKRALDTFLPLRVTEGFDELSKDHKPLIAFYDATGAQLTVLDQKDSWSEIVEEMLLFRGERARFTRSVEARLGGNEADADLVMGSALLSVRASSNAAERLDRASKAFAAANQVEKAQLAQVFAGAAWYGASRRALGLKMIDEVLRNPASDAVAAEAHMARANQYESAWMRGDNGNFSSALGPTMKVEDKRSRQRAIQEYRKAYELAPPGSTTMKHAQFALGRMGDDAPLPARKHGATSLLRVVPPPRTTIVGDADFHVETAGDIARVDYLLDDVKAKSSSKPPFRVSIDVGSTPRVRTVKAIAFDTAGNMKGEAVATINDRVDAFYVSIVSPAAQWIGGTNDVQLDLRVPPGRSVSRVELSWNGKDIATLKAPPFRTKMNATPGEFGYLRALAVLDDGATAETTKVYNSLGVSESVEVGAVTIIASVTDGKGDRVGGLTAKEFNIDDEGKKVKPELRSSDEDPVTIGIAIDSSSSMSGRQLYVMRAATQFITRALRPQDQAFVAAFDTEPRLVHSTSKDAKSLAEVVYGLAPLGGTSIFDGVTFALQQFQGVSGKKALLVFTDGYEGTSSASARECERLARTVGVPVYVIVPAARFMRDRNALEGISKLTGGTMFYGEPEETFPALFDRLAAEMRGQYVLSFTRPPEVKSGAWRNLRVAVQRRDVNVRSIAGYRAN